MDGTSVSDTADAGSAWSVASEQFRWAVSDTGWLGLCPGWDSNPHWTVFETAASAVGLPGRTAPRLPSRARHTPEQFDQRDLTTNVLAIMSHTACRVGFVKMNTRLTMTMTRFASPGSTGMGISENAPGIAQRMIA